MRKDQKGFTLIELVVVIAIIGIVLVSLVGFMVTGTKSYAAASTEVDIQKEAQITMNQIEDLIIDTTKVVTYTYQANETDSEHMVIKDADMPSSPYSKRLCMYNGAVAYEITWKNDGKNQLYYAEYPVVSGAKTGTPTPYLMSDYVTNFQADLTNLPEKRVVQINVDFDNQGRSYQSSNNVTIRNKVVVNNLSHYENPVIPTGTVTNITAQGPVYLAPTESYTFLKPLITGTGVPSQKVTWDFENTGDHDANTIIDSNGTIHISREEINQTFRVKATSVADTSKSAFITVNLIKVKNITIADTSAAGGTSKYKPGSTFGLKTIVDSINIDKDPTGNGDSCTWEIAQGSEYMDDLGVDLNKAHQYRIKQSTPIGTQIIVKATSNHSVHWNYPDDDHISKTFVIMVTRAANTNLFVGGRLDSIAGRWANPSFDADYFVYVKVEKSEANMQNWSLADKNYNFNVTGKFGSDTNYPDYYVLHPMGDQVNFTIPDTLSLDYDYLFTIFQRAVDKKDEKHFVDSDIREELIPRTQIVYTCSTKVALAYKADNVTMHSYVYDSNIDSNTYFPTKGNSIVVTIGIKQSPYGNSSGNFGDKVTMEFVEGDEYIGKNGFINTNRGYFSINDNSIKEGTMRCYPTFTEKDFLYKRPENYVEWKIEYGNIIVDGRELFLPYPSHPTFLRDYASETIGQMKDVGYQSLKWGMGSADATSYYIRATKQTDGSYMVKLSSDSSGSDSYGSFKCSADGTEWKKIN